MEVIEVMDSDMDEPKADMWGTLISTFRTASKSQEFSQLEIIMSMIKRDLTYEDPGLLTRSNIVSLEETTKINACNLWLFNQLVSLSTNDKFIRYASVCCKVV